MGLAISWMAVSGLEKTQVLERWRLAPKGEITSFGGLFGGRIGTCALPDGWTLIVIGDLDHPLTSKQTLELNSAACTVVTFSIEEHVDFSSAEMWENGSQQWQVQYESEGEVPGLEAHGNLPANYAALERECRKNEELENHGPPFGDCIFDLPLLLAASIAGYRHDVSLIDSFELLHWQKPEAGKPRCRGW
jgi:hypothetical protein